MDKAEGIVKQEYEKGFRRSGRVFNILKIMSINTTDLKKKIIYRSTYRGTKEMDTLLTSFTKKYIDTFNDIELINLCDLLDIDDENLYKLNQGEKTLFKRGYHSNNIILIYYLTNYFIIFIFSNLN